MPGLRRQRRIPRHRLLNHFLRRGRTLEKPENPMSILEQIVIWSLAIIFVGSAGLNLAGPEFVREEFEKWNYPSWLRPAVAVMEFTAAALLLMTTTQTWGAVLALLILAAVVFSMARTREWLRMQFPLLMGALCVGLLV
jgi:uncharacterized membrane protein YphA (DoxX/SURF4 family)